MTEAIEQGLRFAPVGTVNFKTCTNSIWEKKKWGNEEENQAVFYNAHEAIISGDVFEKVQHIRQQRHCKTKSGRTSMFSGLVYCADCGEKLYYGATYNGKTEGAFFDCSLHWKRKDKCGTHFIRESVLNRMEFHHIQLVAGYIFYHREHFISVMGQKMRLESAEKVKIGKNSWSEVKSEFQNLRDGSLRFTRIMLSGSSVMTALK